MSWPPPPSSSSLPLPPSRKSVPAPPVVGAVAAVDHVVAGAGVDDVVAAVAEHVVAAVAGADAVVAQAAVDAVVAGAGRHRIVSGAGIDHDIDLDVRRDGDGVVAVAAADRQLLVLGQAHRVVFAVDADVEGAVVALGDVDLVVLGAGGQHDLVGADVLAAAAGVGQGALARDRDLGAVVQRVDLHRLAVGRAGLGALLRIGRAAVDLDRAVGGQARGRFDRRGLQQRQRLGRHLPVRVGGGRVVPVGIGLRRRGAGGVELYGHGGPAR
ncbi:hypothetical protein FE772_04895 [Lysobacter enzymogenes]|nr:hypothetical protein [Lysobacter enzymogenes]QCW25108.1 hypothetical protein FE772_04895 [Lysobacter enzymogenes]